MQSGFDREQAPIGGYDLVVFDWDGTILDTTAAIALSIQYACSKLGLPVPSTMKAKSVIGLGWQDAIKIVAPTLSAEDYPDFSHLYAERYRPAELEVHLFDGIEPLIAALHAAGVELAVATGKSRRGLDRVLEQTGLRRFFGTTKTADQCAPKPNPDMLEEIGVETGISTARTVMVGDTTHDLFMAKAYGCRGVGVTYGAMTRAMLLDAEPAALCDSVQALRRTLGLAG